MHLRSVCSDYWKESHLKSDGLRHGTQMHWEVGRIGDQGTIRTKECTGEVQALLDVHADAGPLQNAAHLFSDAHEPAAHFDYLDAYFKIST